LMDCIEYRLWSGFSNTIFLW